MTASQVGTVNSARISTWEAKLPCQHSVDWLTLIFAVVTLNLHFDKVMGFHRNR